MTAPESESRGRRQAGSRIPSGLLLSLVLIVGVEGFISRHMLDYRGWLNWTWHHAGRAARQEATRAEILCIGDSQVKHGLFTKGLEAALGKPVANIAFSGSQWPTHYFQLRRALEAGARPQAILVNSNPVLLQIAPQTWWDYLELREGFDLGREMGDKNIFGETLARHLLPSWDYRYGIRDSIFAALKGGRVSNRDLALQYRRAVYANRGSIPLAKNPKPILVPDLDSFVNTVFPASGPPGNRYNLHYLRRFFRTAEANHIPVFWLMLPNHPSMDERFVRRGVWDRYDQLLAWATKTFPNVTVLDARRSGYPDSVFFDQGHLDREGASTITGDVAEVLKARLAAPGEGPRIVQLPMYRPQPLAVPIEDLTQSAAALAELSAKEKALR